VAGFIIRVERHLSSLLSEYASSSSSSSSPQLYLKEKRGALQEVGASLPNWIFTDDTTLVRARIEVGREEALSRGNRPAPALASEEVWTGAQQAGLGILCSGWLNLARSRACWICTEGA
jgi:hypothetical protein